MTAAHVGTRIEMFANGTLILPKANTVPKGSVFDDSSAVDAARLAWRQSDLASSNNVSVSHAVHHILGLDILLISDGSMWRAQPQAQRVLTVVAVFAAIFRK